MKIVGFLSEKKFWVVKRLEGGEKRENKICLKIYHINPIKLKTRNFHKLPSCKTTREKYLWSTNFSREDFTREIVVKVFVWILRFHILPEPFSFGFFTIHNIWSFFINTSHFEIGAWNFWYFNFKHKPLAFWAPYISIQVAFPFS